MLIFLFLAYCYGFYRGTNYGIYIYSKKLNEEIDKMKTSQEEIWKLTPVDTKFNIDGQEKSSLTDEVK